MRLNRSWPHTRTVAAADIHTAAILGDDAAVRRFIEHDPTSATTKGGPYGWDALTHLCFSRYLRLDRTRSAGFVRAAEALLDAGASANTGWLETDQEPNPEWESAIYGAAGIAHHPELTRLLLERGADPNDNEAPYHAPETYDNAALAVLVESGKLTAESMATMLLRKADWHDFEGIKYLLEHGADPNSHDPLAFHRTSSSPAARQCSEEHRAAARPWRRPGDRERLGSASRQFAMAVHRGRGDVLELARAAWRSDRAAWGRSPDRRLRPE